MASRTLLLLAVALVLAQSVAALPIYWLQRPNTCGKHPTLAIPPHLVPINDPKTVFTVTPAAGGAAIKANGTLTAGQKYKVKVSWSTDQFHHGLLTTSAGTLNVTTGAPAACKISYATLNADTFLTNVLMLNATYKGKVTLMVTHSEPFLNYLQSNVTFNVTLPATAKKSPPPAPKKLAPPPMKKSPPPSAKKSPPPAPKTG